jgi:hypothetical protein
MKTIDVSVGKYKGSAVETTATRTRGGPVETWRLTFEGEQYAFQCYADHRRGWARNNESIGGIKTPQGELWVWQKDPSA